MLANRIIPFLYLMYATLYINPTLPSSSLPSRPQDVIFSAAGLAGISSMSYALENDVIAIGVDSDQFHSVYGGNNSAVTSDLSLLLTSAQKNVGAAIKKTAMEFLEGILTANSQEIYWFDYSNGGVTLSDCHLACGLMTSAQKEQLSQIENKIAVGLLTTGIDYSTNEIGLYSKDKDLPSFDFASANPFAFEPNKRYDAASCFVNGNLMVFGGVDAESGDQTSDLWEYRPFGLQWTEHTTDNLVNAAGFLGGGYDTPGKRASAAMAPISIVGYECSGCGNDGSLLMFGGWNADDGYLSDLWVFTRQMSWWPAATQWTQIPDVNGGTKPIARKNHAMTGGGSATYLFGGRSEFSNTKEFWKHSFGENNPLSHPDTGVTVHSWEDLSAGVPAELTARHGSMMTVVGDMLYLLGGTDGEVIFTDLYSFNTTNVKWTKLADIPSPIAFASLSHVVLSERGDSLFVYGGQKTSTEVNENIFVFRIPDKSCSVTEGDICLGSWSESEQISSNENENNGVSGEDGSCSCDEARRLEGNFDKFTSMASGGATASGQLITFGGIDVATNIASQSVIVFQTGDRVCDEGDMQFYITDCDVASKRGKIWEWKPEQRNDDGSPKCVVKEADLLKSNNDIHCEYVAIDSSIGSLITTIALASALFCIVVLLWLFSHLKNESIKMSQPKFLMISVCGAVILCAGCFNLVGANTDLNCMSRVYTFNLGFTIMFVPLFCKAYRVNAVFNNKALKKVKVSDLDLFKHISLLVSFEIVLLAIWTFYDPLKEVAGRNPDFEESVCGYEKKGYIGVVNLAYKIALIAYGCLISYRTRNFNSGISEGWYVMGAMYQIGILGLLTLILMALGIPASATSAVQTFSTVLGSISLVILVVFPKFKFRNMSKIEILEMAKADSKSTTSNTTNNATAVHVTGEEVDALQHEIETLKKQIETLQA